jgi:excisionase family DNA binding protein
MKNLHENVAEIKGQLSEVQASIKMLNLTSKAVLNFEEAVKYTGLSKSFLYKLTSNGEIACSKPSGKLLFFKRLDLDLFMLKNRKATSDEVEMKANTYLTIGGQGNGNV